MSQLQKLKTALRMLLTQVRQPDRQLLMLGRLLSATIATKREIGSLSEVEFKVFSQWGDDGIIQWLVRNLDFPQRTFIEFGVEDYRESNTRFLLINDNWSGLVMDGSSRNVSRIIHSEYYWRHNLTAKAVFIDAENINPLIGESGLAEDLGILHIDLDGNDYWIWQRIDVADPVLVIVEYNSVFGAERAITTPYDKAFVRTRAHHSNLYYGSSLAALHRLAADKGYALIGCNSAGNNAYFVRRDKLNERVREVSLEAAYVESAFRESRDERGGLTYLSGQRRIEAIRGLPVFNVDTRQLEPL